MKLDWTEEEGEKGGEKFKDTELMIDESDSPLVTGNNKKKTSEETEYTKGTGCC